MTPEFTPWPKIARLNRDIVITEKIDGTNAAIGIVLHCEQEGCLEAPVVYAQSRTRIITPKADNFGFAKWVEDNRESLVRDLGPGLHFGEWWGRGIQRGYGLMSKDRNGGKRFSLFNTARWGPHVDHEPFETHALDVVPVIYEGPAELPFSINDPTPSPSQWAIATLRLLGSRAAPGYMEPEGIVIWHTAARTMFKVTIEGDERAKGEDLAKLQEASSHK